jgi:hypothetical protein
LILQAVDLMQLLRSILKHSLRRNSAPVGGPERGGSDQ